MDVKLPNGKTIKGIPEGTSKEEIKQKAISSGLATPEDFGDTGEQFQPMEQEGQPQDRGMLERAGSAVGGAISGVQEMFTGEERTGADIERMPGLFESDLLSDLSAAQKAKMVALAQMTSDPNELAKIVTEQVPGTTIQYNRDEQGNVYPIVSDQQGRTAIVNKPGFDTLDAAQFAGDMALFTPAARVGGLAKGVAAATGTEAARQGAQSAAGGEFDEMDVALSGGIEGVGRGVEKVGGAAYRGMTGTPTDEASDVIRAGQEFDVPVMTTDVVPPRTAAGRGARVMAESVPVAGTGGIRASQQEARERAASDFVERYQGGSYPEIVQGLKDKKSRVTRAAGKFYDQVTPKLNEASEAAGGIPFDETQKALESARETIFRPGRKTTEAAQNLVDDIQETITGEGQTFQTVKDNIGAWQNRLDAIDPSNPLNTNDKRILKGILASLRKDRDQFAENTLTPQEFRRLKAADAAYGEMANTIKETRLKNVFNKGDVTPEAAKTLLFSSKPSEVRQLFSSLDDKGRAAARATIMTDITDALSKRAGGQGFTPDTLMNELAKRKPALDVFFRGERRRELNGFMKLMNATRQAQKAQASQTVPTGERVIPWLAIGGASIDPSIIGAYGSVGALGRLYESPRVRSVLARMASAEPGSTQFEQLAKRYREEVTRIAQSLKDQDVPENLTGEDDEPNQNQ